MWFLESSRDSKTPFRQFHPPIPAGAGLFISYGKQFLPRPLPSRPYLYPQVFERFPIRSSALRLKSRAITYELRTRPPSTRFPVHAGGLCRRSPRIHSPGGPSRVIPTSLFVGKDRHRGRGVELNDPARGRRNRLAYLPTEPIVYNFGTRLAGDAPHPLPPSNRRRRVPFSRRALVCNVLTSMEPLLALP